MTAISALISKKWIAAASDSLVTEFHPETNEISHIDFRRSKIVPIRKFKAAAAYWSLAKIGKWNTYDFLKTMARNAYNYDTIEEFANGIKLMLKEKLDGITFRTPIHQGIGIHLIGYEIHGDTLVPELFLISNFANPSYETLKELDVTRNLYGTLHENFRNNEESNEERRNKVIEFLDQGGIFRFNNGDPLLFNPAANAIHMMFNSAISRNVIREEEGFVNYMKLVSSHM